MSKAVQADPQEIKRFAQFLRRFSSDMEASASRAQGGLRSLSSTWRDSKFQEFEREMEKVFKSLKDFSKASEDYSRYLDRLAGDLQQYQNRR